MPYESSPVAVRLRAHLWAGPESAVLMKVQAIKDRWAANARLAFKVKPLLRRRRLCNIPNADGEPEQVVVSQRRPAGTELLTSDAVFEPMQGKQPLVAV